MMTPGYYLNNIRISEIGVKKCKKKKNPILNCETVIYFCIILLGAKIKFSVHVIKFYI